MWSKLTHDSSISIFVLITVQQQYQYLEKLMRKFHDFALNLPQDSFEFYDSFAHPKESYTIPAEVHG